MCKNFCGKNLRGRSFEGQNLTNADFSNTDIRGVNFSGANLTGANFSNAKAGLTPFQRLVLGIIALSSSALVGFGSLVIILIITILFPYSLGTGKEPAIQESAVIIAGLFILFFAIVFCFGRGLIAASTAAIIGGIVFGLLIGSLSGTETGLAAGLVATNLSILYALMLLFLMPIALSGIGAIAGLRAIFLGMFLAFVTGICGTIFGIETIKEVATLIAGTGELPKKIILNIDDARDAGLIISIAIASISGHIAWRTWYGDERFAWINKIGVIFAAIGGTNFYQADLSDANLNQATLENSNLTDAILTRTNFYGVKRLDRAVVRNTILSDPKVQKLLVYRQGASLSLVGCNLTGANLTDADLSGANLKEANIEKATLERACLEQANLTRTKALATNFTAVRLSGACLEDWHINRDTKLEKIHCNYIYLQSGERERRPVIGNLKPEQFTNFYKTSLNFFFRKDLEIKPQLAMIKINRGNFKDGFSVTLQIGKEGSDRSKQFSGQLSSSSEIPQYYRQWQSNYHEGLKEICRQLKSKTRKIEITEIQSSNMGIEKFLEECHTSAEKLKESLNLWLNNEIFRPVKEELLQYLNPYESIRIIVEIKKDAEILRRLPWHLWDFFDRYPKAEIALSSLVYKEPDRSLPSANQVKTKVRILAILGDSTGINVNKDKDFLEKLPDAEVTFKCEPNKKELHDRLWTQHWDILFFAGHSSSSIDGETGQIHINRKDTLKIRDLKNALRKAVEGGLQLAILNSCDGLGLAADLADLQLPQAIVMREPIPDLVAQDFLRNFLEAFSGGNSLYNSVRQAREKLEGLEDEFPCATWLPTIYQNPATIPPTWHDLRSR